MWKLLLAFLFLIAQGQEGFCVTQWNKGAPLASDLKSIWPATSQANNSILDTLVQNYQRGFYLTYVSATTLGVTSGEIVVSNSIATIRLFLVSPTSGTITSANLDTGGITASTTYYVYAGTSTATAAAPSFYISLSSTAPAGVTYYEQIGTFTTDSNSNFTQISNNDFPGQFGAWTSKSAGVVYQAFTDGFVSAYAHNTGSNSTTISLLSDSSSSPSVLCSQSIIGSNVGGELQVGCPIRKGDYYEVTLANGAVLDSERFLSKNF